MGGKFSFVLTKKREEIFINIFKRKRSSPFSIGGKFGLNGEIGGNLGKSLKMYGEYL